MRLLILAFALAAPAPAAVFASDGRTEALDRLLTRVSLDGRGDPRQERLLRETLEDVVLGSETGLDLAGQFLSQKGARAIVSFGASAGRGQHDPDSRPIRVTLNAADYLRPAGAYPESLRVDRADTLAHELFGHVLERYRAEEAGVAKSLGFFQGDEIGALLIGWAVSLERGQTPRTLRIYLDDAEHYERTLRPTYPYYACLMDSEQLKEPLPVLEKRLAEAVSVLKAVRAGRGAEGIKEKDAQGVVSYLSALVSAWSAEQRGAPPVSVDVSLAEVRREARSTFYYLDAENRVRARERFVRSLDAQNREQSASYDASRRGTSVLVVRP